MVMDYNERMGFPRAISIMVEFIKYLYVSNNIQISVRERRKYNHQLRTRQRIHKIVFFFPGYDLVLKMYAHPGRIVGFWINRPGDAGYNLG